MSDSIPRGRHPKRGPGRRSLYTPELAAAICDQIAHGESLVSIAHAPGMPSYQTIIAWLKAHSDFEAMYRQAREDQADTLADEIIAIADSVRDTKDAAAVNAARLRVDARKWVAAKLKPKVYGDRVETALAGNVTVQHTITDEDRVKALASLFARQAIQTAPNMIEAQRLIADTRDDTTDMTDR